MSQKTVKFDPSNTLIVGDIHEPFSREGYLEFCIEQQREYRCGNVILIGDVVDNHYSSYHETDPDGLGAGQELENAIRRLKKWYKAFPIANVCIGNHDEIVTRKMFTGGISKIWMRNYSDVFETPGWNFQMEHVKDHVLYLHGTGSSGEKAAFNKALNRRISTVQGHLHTASSIMWNVSNIDRIFGMQVGCGIDEKAYALAYARNFAKKFILSCGVVLNSGQLPIVVPMPL